MSTPKTHIKKGGWTPALRNMVAMQKAIKSSEARRARMTPKELERDNQRVHRDLAKHHYGQFKAALARVPDCAAFEVAEVLNNALERLTKWLYFSK
jgi:hypothetical protein